MKSLEKRFEEIVKDKEQVEKLLKAVEDYVKEYEFGDAPTLVSPKLFLSNLRDKDEK